MSEIEVKGRKYVTGKLNARQQFHIARRLAPLLSSLAEALAGSQAAAAGGDDALLASVAGPIGAALAKIPEADCDYVIDTCLAVCKRVQGTAQSPVLGKGGVMFDDMDLADLTQIAVLTIQENLGGFFAAAPAPSA